MNNLKFNEEANKLKSSRTLHLCDRWFISVLLQHQQRIMKQRPGKIDSSRLMSIFIMRKFVLKSDPDN